MEYKDAPKFTYDGVSYEGGFWKVLKNKFLMKWKGNYKQNLKFFCSRNKWFNKIYSILNLFEFISNF